MGMNRTAVVAITGVLLAVLGAQPAQSAFPGDNGRIVFTSSRDGNFDIYSMDADGSDVQRLTSATDSNFLPAWSPDGSKIVFTSLRDGNHEIYVMNADGSGQTNLSNNAAIDHEPSWSPDGNKILFAGNRTGDYEIFVMNADGSNVTQLTTSFGVDEDPVFSPDGTKIAFGSNRTGNSEIFVMNADGTGAADLTNFSAGSDAEPDWSPDGSTIAFWRFQNGVTQSSAIFVMNADGTGQQQLIDTAGGDEGPVYSPDGAKIAFSSSAFNDTDVLVMNAADGSGSTNLTNVALIDKFPDWQATTPPPDPPSFTVNSTADTDDGACTASNCTLREAINRANAEAGTDTIGFNIAGAAPHTIEPASALPELTEAVIIDGTTDPAFTSCADGPVVELSGVSAAGTFVNGLLIKGGNSTVRGLVINRFSGDGLKLMTGGGNLVECNYVGTDVDGAIARPNGLRGVVVANANNTIGGTGGAASRNVISGNTHDAGIYLAGANGSTVQGNYVGTDASGSAALGNIYGIYAVAGSGNLIGGTAAGAGNVVSANKHGIIVQNSGANQVEGNLIGTDAAGTAALGNTQFGVEIIDGSSDNVVGGTTAGAGNVIANSGNDGVTVGGGTGTADGNQIAGNSVFSNGGLGIDLDPDGVNANDAGDADTGANDGQNFPEITSAKPSEITGTLDAAAGTYRIELFSSPACDGSGHGEGRTYLGFAEASPGTPFTFSPASPLTTGEVVTATATSPGGDTSEFSVCRTVVAGIATTTTLTAAPSPSSFGQSVTLSAVVDAGGDTPTGTATFLDGAVELGTATLSGGTATLETAALAVGTHSLTASYAGDGDFQLSVSPAVAHDVKKATTTLRISSSPSPSEPGESVTLTATATESAPGTPEGSVVFTEGYNPATSLGSAPLVNGVATLTVAGFPEGGWRYLTALYGGDGSFAGSTTNGYHVILYPSQLVKAVDDAATTNGKPIYISVLANDTPSYRHAKITSWSAPGQGSANCYSYYDYYYYGTWSGGCYYTPNSGAAGTDTFTYTITEGSKTSTATVTITIVANHSPVANDDSYQVVGERDTLLYPAQNDTDADGDWLQVTGSTSPAHGTVACAWTCRYTPNAGYTGPDSFTYDVEDGLGGTDTAVVTLDVITNRPPVANGGSITVRGNRTGYTYLYVTASDPDVGDSIRITGKTSPAHGSVSCTQYWCSYNASSGYSGPDSFTYTVTDLAGATATGTISVTVQANGVPIANPDSFQVRAGSSSNWVYVQGNDSDPDRDYLYLTGCTGASHGTVNVYYGGYYCIYTPEAGFTGTDTFTYTIIDYYGGTATGTVTVTVVENRPPVAVDDSISAHSGVARYVYPQYNDTDPDGDWRYITGGSGAAHGTVACSTWYCRYTAAPEYTGSDSFTYTISDGYGGTATGTVSVNVGNAAPDAIDDAITVRGRSWLSIVWNDVDPDGDRLSLSVHSAPEHGTVTCDTWWCTYTAESGYSGPDSFTYGVDDGHGGTDTASVSLTVVADQSPIAADDAATADASGLAMIDLLANDTDPDPSDYVWLQKADQPAHGVVQCSYLQCLYVAETGFTGTDSFTYTISDNFGLTDVGTVTITVGGGATSTSLKAKSLDATALATNPPQAGRASVAANGDEPNRASRSPAVSDDGRYVAFESDASNLVAADFNEVTDVFVRDTANGKTTRVSVGFLQTEGDGPSTAPALSADGRYVAFTSAASTLEGGDENGKTDVFVHDRTTGKTELISRGTAGQAGNDASGGERTAISADGRYVAFESSASDLVPGDTNGVADVFVRDRQTDETTIISHTSGGAAGNGASHRPEMSADGRFVAFQSDGTDLVSGDGNGHTDVFLADLISGDVVRVSLGPGDAELDGDSVEPSLSDDGGVVAFASDAPSLGADGAGFFHVYRREVGTSAIERVSERDGNIPGHGNNRRPTLSGNGQYVAFDSDAPDLAAGDADEAPGVFMHDSQRDLTWSLAPGVRPALTGDAAFAAIESEADDLFGDDHNGAADVYLVSALPERPLQVSVGAVAIAEGDAGARSAVFRVTLNKPAPASLSVKWSTLSASALAGSDFTESGGTLRFRAGQTAKNVTVPVLPDAAVEGDEAFSVVLSDPVNVALGDAVGIGSIIDDDPAPGGSPRMSIGDVWVHEGGTGAAEVTFTVVLDRKAPSAVTFSYQTADGTAVAPGDYTASPATSLKIGKGKTSATFTVPIAGDVVIEPNETISVILSSALGATITDGTALATIVDDDG